MLSPVALKSEILRAARTLGFDDCRIAPIHRASHADIFKQWLDHGKYGDMAWMARQPERRTDPALVLPGVQAMIVVAKNYHVATPATATFQPADDLPDAPPPAATGVIAKYAWGDDYHDLMQMQLRHLCDTLSAHGGVQKLYVDTGPVLERDFASDAGLGWNGKSTVQIHPKLGTWFFLGEILTTLPLPPDQPFGDHCGKCTRCMTACPTQAITAPRQMDARRCLSYLTIEHKGSIPLEFRKLLGNRIYGCDDCLAVCPWNRFAQASNEAAFTARDYVHGWTLRKFLSLNDDDFRTLFKGSPIKRLKRGRFLRNVCVALGNTGSRDDIPALQTAAADADPLIAEHALWAIAEIRQRG